jgi:molybdopterin-guanine dinucleotide biosynthesis protein A
MISNAKIYGLVLSGGKSTRMGADKGLISYHGMPQRDYLYRMLGNICEAAYMSVRENQRSEFKDDTNVIVDRNEFRGPYNGLLSAHKQFPDVAWFVLACDLPLMDEAALQELVSQRDASQITTAFALNENPLPEPLCAIWEPHALRESLAYLEAGNGTCPRKFLINNDTELVFPKNENVLLNANSEAEYKEALEKLRIG